MNVSLNWLLLGRYGLIYSLILILTNLILYITGTSVTLNWLQITIMMLTAPGSVYFGIVALRDTLLDRYITYGGGVLAGLKIGVIAGIIMVAYQFVYIYVIDPEAVEKMIKLVTEKMMNEGSSDEEIERMVHMLRKISNPYWSGFTTFFTHVFYAGIASLVVAFFTRREDPNSAYNDLNN